NPSRKGLILDEPWARAIQSNSGTSRLTDFRQSTREIRDEGDRNELQCAGGALGERATQRRAVPPGHDEPCSTECGRGTQYGPDVLRVRHLVEHDDRSRLSAAQHVGQRVLGERVRLEQCALVHHLGTEELVEVAGPYPLCLYAARSDCSCQTPLGIFSEEQPVNGACRIAKRSL